jgi:hypothetical protein
MQPPAKRELCPSTARTRGRRQRASVVAVTAV